TAYFLLEKQLTVRGTCALFVPVFDGSALYNLRSTDVKRETLSADDHQNFAGSSQVCEIVRQDLVLNPDPPQREPEGPWRWRPPALWLGSSRLCQRPTAASPSLA